MSQLNPNKNTQQLEKLVTNVVPARAEQLVQLLGKVFHHPDLQTKHNPTEVPRKVIAHALNVLLLDDLLERVPLGKSYVDRKHQAGEEVLLDHGALRTVCTAAQAAPSGHWAFERFLLPLGYELAGQYPLPKLNMCGFVYCHADLPNYLSQFFVSELYPEKFSPNFQNIVQSILSSSADPLMAPDLMLLNKLATQTYLDFSSAVLLLKALLTCFARHHPLPSLDQYQSLLSESPEMAWIATEGQVFNHATDRVLDVAGLHKEQQALGMPIKADIEFGQSANIKQTAYKATMVERLFACPEGPKAYSVPGSFFEFIERGLIQLDNGGQCLDLRFDSKNATGIFGMTKI